jgi:hypothetical protein
MKATSLTSIQADLIESLKLAGFKIRPNQIEILDWGCSHTKATLPKGKMAVYIFFYNDECLKVGKAGPNSRPRYSSHHYNPHNSGSNLSKSLLLDKKSPCDTKSKRTIGEWIKNNTRRINILLDERLDEQMDEQQNKRLGMFVLNFVEAYFQVKFKPRYEGRSSRKKS